MLHKLFDIQTQENIGLSRLIKAQKKLLKEHELFQNYYQSEMQKDVEWVDDE